MFKSTNLDQFTFPFKAKTYRYSNDLVELGVENVNFMKITPEYEVQIRKKREMLDAEPNVRYQSFPHTMEMQWEFLEMIIDMAVEKYPEHFKVEKKGDQWTFYNLILGEEENFIFGDETSIPYEPYDFIGRHFHNDFMLMVHRDDNFHLEVAQISFAALFSPNWNLGMTFNEIHAPVPFVSRDGVDLVDRIRKFLLTVEPGKPRTRVNWNLMADRWDVNYETMDIWGPERDKVTKENAGKLVHLRVEEQWFIRMPRSNAILFVLDTQFLPLEDLQKRPEWLELTYSNLSDIPDYMAEYKGMAPFLPQSVEYLKNLVEHVQVK
ncbi:DUF3445 domain-containing protein [Bacillus sp. FJAT-52991]|uniref:DUF3445 domain-containing protein n=1 Tax=Bacillus kandeliae TaxID=3129297 RepID=A0ABZ2N609_9BACI